MTEPMKILVIDDSEDDRLFYRRTLKKSSLKQYSIIEADEGEVGLRSILEDEPACILLDYSLPGYDGVEILRRIRNKHPFIPVVMMTGQGNEKLAVTAMQAGAQNYIAKSSITPETLEHVIQVAVEHCQLQKRIDEQRASLEVFTRALAHDLKEPVRTIRSFAELVIEQGHATEPSSGYLQHIHNAAEHMHQLIDTVFLYTRLDDAAQMVREPCTPAALLKEVSENLTQLIGEHKATITYDNLPTTMTNRVQLIQLFQNLICNAIRHSDKEPVIRIEGEERQEDCLFRVHDNGPGIDPAHFHKIFEPFKRLRRDEEGTGLGLAICKKIVETHGGKIWCESTPGHGATFCFTLPRSTTAAAPALRLVSDNKAPLPAESASERLLANLLLVDDRKADLEITRINLVERAKLQCNILIAHDGEEALALLRDQATAVDLMLLDINMPEIDGFEVLEKLNAQPLRIRPLVVMCTGSTYDKDMERAEKLGAIGYVVKPVQFSVLKQTIEKTERLRLQKDGAGFALLRA